MTATDQLLQKHVGDVFPAEIADFPLDEAVKRGVVAPLRCLRVQPGASLRNVPVVGGDYDQRLLAAALDHDALNMAAAMYYADRFGDRAGIVYAAGVDHAERVAQALRAAGVKAKAVTGRTPPRVLAETLAAYERGETNVLVNAQLLAEGWNAPRATICMHLAPTASRRVYQQRVGRIMRLHRRKEAGVVVDFADPAAPHSDRTVTLHSLLDADVYRPGALVTPRPPRRRQRWRRTAKPIVREADWFVPVTDDPERRRAAIVHDWKTVAADMLPPDEQELWAETAARRVAPADLHAPRRDAREGLGGDAHRLLRDLRRRVQAPRAAPRGARRPRLAAPRQQHRRPRRPPDRGGADLDRRPRPGRARAAARARRGRLRRARCRSASPGRGGSPGPSRDAQFRVATRRARRRRATCCARMASSRGEEHHVKAKLLVMAAKPGRPAARRRAARGRRAVTTAWPAGSSTTRASSSARIPSRWRCALASNIPAQTERARPKTRRRRVKPRRGRHAGRRRREGRAGSAAGTRGRGRREDVEATASECTRPRPRPLTQAGDAPPSRSKRRRRRRRKRRDAEAATTGDVDDARATPWTRPTPRARSRLSMLAGMFEGALCAG